ncbi:unnamed protein product [Prunus armeniaca]|uniref:Uncharacterized protein n=1 Tax=Prunus armeniaca TaxID=36596 RepID=A0A6J5XJ08_PRUAR|nr:unnamed protein product [Prunus armeniaca]
MFPKFWTESDIDWSMKSNNSGSYEVRSEGESLVYCIVLDNRFRSNPTNDSSHHIMLFPKFWTQSGVIWSTKSDNSGSYEVASEMECIPLTPIGSFLNLRNLSAHPCAGLGAIITVILALPDPSVWLWRWSNSLQAKIHSGCCYLLPINIYSTWICILVYYEDKGFWTMGFLVSLGSAIVGLVSYLLAAPRYRYIKPSGNPLPRVAQVFVAAFRNGRLFQPALRICMRWKDQNLQSKGVERFSTVFGQGSNNNRDGSKWPHNPWRVCTVTQVEEAKCVLKMLPIWLCTIIYSVVFTQMASLFVEQGDVMESHIGNFHFPAASMSLFDIFSVLICTGIYRQIVVPVSGRLSGNPKGLSELQRMGIGLIIGLLSMVAAGATEVARLKHVQPGQKVSSLSIFWQIPQYVLVGTSEIFMYVGQLEFFNGQAPDGIKSLGSSLCMASISLGNYVSSLLVTIVMMITARGENPGWIPNNLNEGHLDRFYFLIAILTALDFVVYVFCAKRYKGINLQEPEQEMESIEAPQEEVGINRV